MRFIPRFGHTTKVSYSLLRSPKRVESFSTLILHKPTTKIKANSFIKLAQESEWYKLLRVIHNLGDSKATSICRGTRTFQEQQVRTRGVCQKKLKRWEEEGRGKPNPKVTSTNLTPRALQSSDLGAIWGVCVWECVWALSQVRLALNAGEWLEWGEIERWGVFIESPQKGAEIWNFLRGGRLNPPQNHLNWFWLEPKQVQKDWFDWKSKCQKQVQKD
jgi:hypothetical protein